MATTTTMCPDPQLRFLCYTLISRFLDMCTDDAKVYILSELLERCPWPAMRAASVGLLKEQVQRAFDDTVGPLKEGKLMSTHLTKKHARIFIY